MKAKPKVYKGIEFINISDLPTNQQLLLQHNSKPERIKILMDGKIQKNCIQYNQYSKWYTSVYEQSITSPIEQKSLQLNNENSIHLNLKVAIDKAS
jgi:hypothetical protein